MRRAVLAAALLLLAVTAEGRRRAVVPRSDWGTPQCASVSGIPVVTTSLDGGITSLPFTEVLEDVQLYTFALAALDRPNRLLAAANRTFARSDDAGCTWTLDGRMTFPHPDNRFVAIRGGSMWAWSVLGPELFLIGDTIVPRTAPVTPIGFHAPDATHLALGNDQGAIHLSDDGGATWRLQATAPARPPLYTLEFSPRGRAHIVAGGLADGAHVTFDGGQSWTPSAGLERLNVFRVAFSPVSPDVVWAIAADPLGTGDGRRAIYHSRDGGRSFVSILRGSDDLQFSNGFTVAPHPSEPSLLYFALAGTTLHLIDDRGTIHWRAVHPHRDINAIVFSPASPRVMYFGLKLSGMS